jgi:hypothetical protein
MNPGAGHAGVIISWSLGEDRERLDLYPCKYGRVLITDPPAKYRCTTHIHATGYPDHHSIAKYFKELLEGCLLLSGCHQPSGCIVEGY